MGYTPADADDEVIPAGATQAPAGTPQGQTYTPVDHDDEVVAGSSAGPTALPDPTLGSKTVDPNAPLSDPDAIRTHLQALMDDPKVTTQQIRDFYTQQGGKISEHDDHVFQMRDAFIKTHGKAPVIGQQDDPNQVGGTPGLVDNRPYSFSEGVSQGIQHTLTNIAGGVGFVGNHIGLNNNFYDGTKGYFQHLEDGRDDQGSGAGKVVGETVSTLPALALAAPIAAGAGAIGVTGAAATGLGLAGAGLVQGALATDSSTPSGVAKDAIVGSGVNTILGGAGHLAGDVLAAGVKPTQAAIKGREVLDAAGRLSRDGLKVDVMPAMVGGNFTKGATAIGEAGLASNIPISKAADGVVNTLEGARNRAADALAPQGQTAKPIQVTADNVLNAKGGLGDYEQASSDAIGKQYQAASDAAKGTTIAAPKTLSKLNQIIKARYAQPGGPGPGITALEALRDDLTPSPEVVNKPSLLARVFKGAKTTVTPADPAQYAIQQLRDTRTNFGDNFDVNQRAIRSAAKDLWGPLSEDIQTGLRGAGKTDAADQYAAADKAWATRQDNLDNVVNPLLGNRSSEQLGTKLIQMSKTDSDGLDKALSLMHPDQAAHVKASIVKDLGRANPGGQNAAGDAFSPAVFAKDYDGLKQATSGTFSSGQTGQDLHDIARVAQASKEGAALRNHSGTGRIVEAGNFLGKLFSGNMGIHTAGASLAGEYGAGNVLASSKVAEGLVRAGEARLGTKAALRTITQAPKTNIAWDKIISGDNSNDQQ